MNNINNLGEEFAKNPNFEVITRLMGEINKQIYGVNPYMKTNIFDGLNKEQAESLFWEHDCKNDEESACSVCQDYWNYLEKDGK